MFLTLNEDCLRAIFDYLEFEDLVVLAYTYKDLQGMLKTYLTRSCKRVSLLDAFWESEENKIYIPDYLNIIAPIVEVIALSGDYLSRNKEWLQHLSFPKVNVLQLTLSDLHFSQRDTWQLLAKLFPNAMTIKMLGTLPEVLDKSLEMIAEFYPQVNKLKLNSKCTDKSLTNLKNLEELYIHTGTTRFDTRLFQKILSLPQLKRLTFFRFYGLAPEIYTTINNNVLEELTLHYLDFENLKEYDVFNKLKNLRKVTVYEYPRNYLLELDNKYFHRIIDGMSISRRYSPFIKVKLAAPYLRKLWFNRDFDILPDFCGIEPKIFECLEELHYIKSTASEKTKKNLLNVVSRSPNLKLLNISGTCFGIEFVKDILQLIKGKTEFSVCCYDTNIENKDLSCLELPEVAAKFKISFEKLKHNLPKLNAINFQIYFKD